MLTPSNDSLWMQEKDIEKQIQHDDMEQEIYWAKRAQTNWFFLGNTKYSN